MGGGIADNDGRFMASAGDYTTGDEGALEFLTSVAASQQPFFMIISLVNPHDVLAYPRNFTAGGLQRRVAGRRHRPPGHRGRGPPRQAAALRRPS